jgi:hypothetical protein
MDGRQLQQQYKHHISDYRDWDQREHATEWMLFEKNMGTHLSIDETALSRKSMRNNQIPQQFDLIQQSPQEFHLIRFV